ncbi:hypothetical protein NQ315_002153 [Exocentrus adspersus]|uniref:Sas10 C-terminal domain-containing protein n=1 Tax=Exocentrus adspersus TaxID=1586481 RepID=A0AAV8VYR8_9CUCU|nr:hypothetical protein NQ315_002153 [Exocentrus adspersus]
MPAQPRSEDEEESLYSPSDSEDDYNEKEKQLLKKVRSKKKEYSDSEEEVFNVGANNEEGEDDEDRADDDKSDLALSDIEGQGSDDDLPDIRAWGKDRKKYYSTDFVDPDYGGLQGKDAYLAELEEEEARSLQKQLVEQLDSDDISFDIFAKKTEDDKVEVDVSKLSKKQQKLRISQRDSPEFFWFVEDFEAKMVIARDYLNPVLKKHRAKQIPSCRAVDFVQTHYELILNYCVNIYMYLLLKASKVNIKNHPILKRLHQYKQLLSQLEPAFEEIVKPQIEIIMQETQIDEEAELRKTDRKKTLKLLSSLVKKPELGKKKKQVTIEEEPRPSKKIKIDVADMEVGSDDELAPSEEAETENNDVEKRAITYKMAKNKGLTPRRKKEQRNPRVKHKLKYKKALVRRKGAVREPRKELTRYSGEISGIKATVSKSIKIKT